MPAVQRGKAQEVMCKCTDILREKTCVHVANLNTNNYTINELVISVEML